MTDITMSSSEINDPITEGSAVNGPQAVTAMALRTGPSETDIVMSSSGINGAVAMHSPVDLIAKTSLEAILPERKRFLFGQRMGRCSSRVQGSSHWLH